VAAVWCGAVVFVAVMKAGEGRGSEGGEKEEEREQG